MNGNAVVRGAAKGSMGGGGGGWVGGIPPSVGGGRGGGVPGVWSTVFLGCTCGGQKWGVQKRVDWGGAFFKPLVPALLFPQVAATTEASLRNQERLDYLLKFMGPISESLFNRGGGLTLFLFGRT